MGINDLLKQDSNIDVVTNNIMKITTECKTSGINNIFASGLTINNRLYSGFISAVNNALKSDCIKYGYNFIENSNILPDDHWQDGLHLSNSGKGKLLNNFLVSLTKNYFKVNLLFNDTNRAGYESGESVNCSEDNFITQDKIVPNSFDSTEHNDILDAKTGLRDMKIQCPEKIIVSHLNIKSIRNKSDALSFIIDTNIDILLISETKLDNSFSSTQFRLKGFCTPYKVDRNSEGGGFLLYFREIIPSRFLSATCNMWLNMQH